MKDKLLGSCAVMLLLFVFGLHYFWLPNFAEILDYSVLVYPTDESGSTYIPTLRRPQGLFLILLVTVFIVPDLQVSFFA